jgi:hypothetical protein
MTPFARRCYADGHARSGNITKMKRRRAVGLLVIAYLLAACTPVVQVAVPDKPITINLNVKIEHEVRVKVDKELDNVFSKDSGLF